MSNLPDYVVQVPPLSDPQWPPPYRFENVDVQVFMAGAAGSKLQAICDRFLNDIAEQNNSPFRFNPVTGTLPGIVSIFLMRYEKMFSMAPGHENLGYTSQNELTFGIPVVMSAMGIPISVGYFMPYVLVDNCYSLISGRDVIGFPKVEGSFLLTQDPSEVDGTEISTLAPQQFSSTTKNENKKLFEVNATALPQSSATISASQTARDEHTPEEIIRPHWPYGPLNQLYATGQDFAIEDERIVALLEADAGIKMRNFSFKQIRDAQQTDSACFQAIVSSTTQISDFQFGGFLDNFEITLHNYPNLNIANNLGLDIIGNKIKPLAATYYKLDFDFKNVQNLIVRCGADVQTGLPPLNCFSLFAKGTQTMLKFYEGAAKAWLKALEDMASGHNR